MRVTNLNDFPGGRTSVGRASGVPSCMSAVSAPGEDEARGSRACLAQNQLQQFSEILVQNHSTA